MKAATAPGNVYPLTLLYDAACPVCALEMDHLRELSRDGRLVFVDISAAGFDPAAHGTALADLNAEIHGLCADGTLLRGVAVLRLAYEAAGIGWVLRPTGWAPVRPLFDVAYRVFARHRQAISRGAAPLVRGIRLLRARQTARRLRECQSGACGLHRCP